MEDQLLQQLKRLKAIRPDPTWVAATRGAFAGSPPKAVLFFWNRPSVLRWAAPAAAGLALLAFAALSPGLRTPIPPAVAAALDTQNLSTEFQNLPINIELSKIGYQDSANATVASAITEITDTRTRHLSPPLLQAEIQKLSLPADTPTPDNTIDQMLNQVIF